MMGSGLGYKLVNRKDVILVVFDSSDFKNFFETFLAEMNIMCSTIAQISRIRFSTFVVAIKHICFEFYVPSMIVFVVIRFKKNLNLMSKTRKLWWYSQKTKRCRRVNLAAQYTNNKCLLQACLAINVSA